MTEDSEKQLKNYRKARCCKNCAFRMFSGLNGQRVVMCCILADWFEPAADHVCDDHEWKVERK